MTKVPYSDKLDFDDQVTTEESIAAHVFAMSDGTIDEETCGDIGRDALYIALRKFRPELLDRPEGWGKEKRR